MRLTLHYRGPLKANGNPNATVRSKARQRQRQSSVKGVNFKGVVNGVKGAGKGASVELLSP
jgi:hypothetical protein